MVHMYSCTHALSPCMYLTATGTHLQIQANTPTYPKHRQLQWTGRWEYAPASTPPWPMYASTPMGAHVPAHPASPLTHPSPYSLPSTCWLMSRDASCTRTDAQVDQGSLHMHACLRTRAPRTCVPMSSSAPPMPHPTAPSPTPHPSTTRTVCLCQRTFA